MCYWVRSHLAFILGAISPLRNNVGISLYYSKRAFSTSGSQQSNYKENSTSALKSKLKPLFCSIFKTHTTNMVTKYFKMDAFCRLFLLITSLRAVAYFMYSMILDRGSRIAWCVEHSF